MPLDNPALGSKKLRQAIQHAIDLPLILEAAFFGAADASTGIIAPGLIGHRPESLVPPEANFEKAAQLLAESGAYRFMTHEALPAVFGAMAIGLTLGMIAGYGPKWLDALISLLFDTIRSFPTVMFALAVLALVGPRSRRWCSWSWRPRSRPMGGWRAPRR